MFKFKKKVKKTRSVREDILVNEKDSPLASEAFINLATNLTFAVSGKEDKKAIVIAVTSPLSAEGKSTVCANTAVALAKIKGRTLLIDADMRKPRIHKFFGIQGKAGLSSYLSGQKDADSIIINADEKNLSLIVCGVIPPNPAELLSGDGMKKLIDKFSSQYDYIIIDTPPLGIVSDTLNLSSVCDGYVIVVRSNVTTKSEVDNLIIKFNLAKIKILGCVLNNVELNKKGYYRHYKYRSYGKYESYESHQNHEGKAD